VTGLKNHNRLRTLWNGQTCLIDFDMPGKTIRCRISNRSYALSANGKASSLPDDPDERSRFRRRVGGGDLYRFRDWCRLGSYNQLSSSPVDSTITVQCSKDSGPPTILNYTILLSAGQSGSFAPRKMASGANRFRYNLYTDAARLRVWDTGASGTVTVSSAATCLKRKKVLTLRTLQYTAACLAARMSPPAVPATPIPSQ